MSHCNKKKKKKKVMYKEEVVDEVQRVHHKFVHVEIEERQQGEGKQKK